MSQINTQGLLNFQTPGLSTNVTPSAPEFIEQKVVGGQVQIGQPSQQVGPTGEAALYGALAEIAQGTAKGLDTFGRISSMIEKNKIDRANIIFNEIDNREDLSPEQKVEEFDKQTKEIYTPMLGDSWRKELENRQNKQWLSTPARNAYEEMRYTKALNNFRNRPENQGGLDTPEELDRFQQEYAFTYPSANYNDWYKNQRATVVAGVSVNKGKRLVLDFKTLLDNMYRVPSKQEFSEYLLNTTNPAVQAQFNEKYPRFFELMGNLNLAGGPESIYETVYNHIRGSYLDSSIAGKKLPPSVVEAIMPEIDSLISGKVSEFMSLHFEESAIKQTQTASTGVIVASDAFKTHKNISQFLTQVIDPVSSLGIKERNQYIYALIPTILTSKQEDPLFTEKSFYTQTLEIQTEVENWYNQKDENGNFVNKNKFDKLLKATLGPSITFDLWLTANTDALMSSDVGQDVIKTQADRVIADLNVGKQILALPNITNPEFFIAQKEKQLEELLGIPEPIIKQFAQLVESDDSELGTYINYSSIREFYNQKLTPEQKQELAKRGFTGNNLEQFTRIFSTYADMKYTTQGKGTSSAKALTGIPDAGAQPHVIFGKFFDPGNSTFRNTIPWFKQLTPQQQQEVLSSTPQLLTFLNQIDTEDRAFNALLGEKRKLLNETITSVSSNPNLPLVEKTAIIEQLKSTLELLPSNISLYSLDQTEQATPTGINASVSVVSPVGFVEQNKAFLEDKTNVLNSTGIKHYLRLEFLASRYAQMQQSTPERTVFFNEFETILKQIGSSTFSDVARDNPTLIYSAAAVLSGIRKGDPTGTISSYVSGSGSELTEMLGMLVSGAADFHGGVLHSLDTKNPNDILTRRIDILGAYLDIATSPLAQNGYGSINELIPREYGISRPENRLDEISSLKTGLLQQTGQNGYRDVRVIQSLANVFGFGNTSQTNLEGLRNAFESLMPDIRIPEGSSVYLTDVNGNSIQKNWTDAREEEKIQYYLTKFFEQTGTTGVKFIASWIQESENPKQAPMFKDPLLFAATGKYLVNGLPMATASQRQSSITQYHTENNVTIGTQERFAWNWFGTTKPNSTFSHRPQRVVDAKNYRRAELFDLAQGLRGTSANVLNQDSTIPWATVGSEFTTGNSTYLIGETTTESRFIVESLLSQEPNYQQYSFWVKTLGGQPVNETEFNRIVTETSKNNPLLRPSMRDVGLPRETRLIKNVDVDVVKAPLAAIVLRLNPIEGNKLLDTDLNGNYHLGLSVDNGLLQVEIGKQRYTLPGNLKEVYLKPGQYTNENDLTRRRNYTEYLRQEWLKLQRTYKVTP